MLGAKDRIHYKCCFPGVWAGRSSRKEVSGVVGKVIGPLEYGYQLSHIYMSAPQKD